MNGNGLEDVYGARMIHSVHAKADPYPAPKVRWPESAENRGTTARFSHASEAIAYLDALRSLVEETVDSADGALVADLQTYEIDFKARTVKVSWAKSKTLETTRDAIREG
jgi:hypothetical protein